MIRIGVDVDEVLADFRKAFMEVSRDLIGKPAPGHVWKSWDVCEALGITKDEAALVWQHVMRSPDFLLTLDETVDNYGAAAFLSGMARQRVLIPFFITARHEQPEGDTVQMRTFQWLQSKGVEFPTVIVSNNKGPIVKALDLDAFIDDNIEQCLSVKEHSPRTRTFLQIRSHNLHEHERARRAGVEPTASLYNALADLSVIDRGPKVIR